MKFIIPLIFTVAAINRVEECLPASDPTGLHYNGHLRTSASGKRCQRWGEDQPRKFRRFCRKIEAKDKPGCMVKIHGEKSFQYCHVPPCLAQFESILVVYSRTNDYWGQQLPFMLHGSGIMSSVANIFEFGDGTGSYRSCSATINGRMMIFGGYKNTPYINQISEVKSCQLKRVGDLPIDFDAGTCNTFRGSLGMEAVLLCFSTSDKSACMRYQDHDGFINVTSAPSSNYSHFGASLGQVQNTPITVGEFARHKKVEALENEIWTELADFPFVDQNIALYSFVTFNESLYLFGYGDGRSLDIAVKCSQIPTDATMWTGVGALMHSRSSHRSIVMGKGIMHIGGGSDYHFEQWTINEPGFLKEELDATLSDYMHYPESFLVSANFCV